MSQFDENSSLNQPWASEFSTAQAIGFLPWPVLTQSISVLGLAACAMSAYN